MIKTFTHAACLAAFMAVVIVGGASAETTAAAPATKTSDADKLAKAADCSKQADAKKLHGEARKTFREACKKK